VGLDPRCLVQCQEAFLAKLAGIHMPILFQSIDFCSSCHWLFTAMDASQSG
jgi:hypothetical protein